MKKKDEDIELKGEELQEVLSSIPSWILRWGIVGVAVIIIIMLVGTAFFKYPEVITAQVTLTGTIPIAGIVAKNSGKLLKIFVHDKQNVHKGECLAIIESPTKYEDILYLKQYIVSFMTLKDTIIPSLPKENINLGNIQSSYTIFCATISEYIQFKELNYYVKKISLTKEKRNRYQYYHENMKRQALIIEKQSVIAQKKYTRDSTLNHKDLISDEETENTYNNFLNGKLALEGILSTLENTNMQIAEMNESLLDMKYQYVDKKQTLENQLKTQAAELLNEIQTWEMNYLLISPLNGFITFTKYWVENQNIVVADEVFNIVPSNQGIFIGKALLPIDRSGKVKVGQIVNIRFDNFPETEFGIVKGYVKNISLVPSKDNNISQYVVEIGFSNELKTTYDKVLPFLPKMEGRADIITDDLSLLERILLPIKNILKNS